MRMRTVRRTYLDYNATAPCRAEVRRGMAQCALRAWGNPSGVYREARRARAALDRARAQVAAALGADPSEIVFTGGGTEANNLAIRGTVAGARVRHPHVVTTAIEHPSVLNVCRAAREFGASVTFVGCDRRGFVSEDEVAAALRRNTVLVSVMHANNEVGTVQPVARIGRMTRRRGIPLHVDAVQSFGKVGVDVAALGADLLSVSAHKIGGPKGVGALYVSGELAAGPSAIVLGGKQERGVRPGTENVAGIVGFGLAARAASRQVESERERLRALRDRLWRGMRAGLSGVHLNGSLGCSLPNTLNVSFAGLNGDALMRALDRAGVAVSTGSACAVGAGVRSHVLDAMRVGPERLCGPIRFSLGYGTTVRDVDRAVSAVLETVTLMRRAGACCCCG